MKDFFLFEPRGRLLTKEKKELEMHAVTSIQPALLAGASEGTAVPAAFAQHYRTYFDKTVPAFPAFRSRRRK